MDANLFLDICYLVDLLRMRHCVLHLLLEFTTAIRGAKIAERHQTAEIVKCSLRPGVFIT